MKLFQRITLALMGCMLLTHRQWLPITLLKQKPRPTIMEAPHMRRFMALSTITAARMRWIFRPSG
ncbi:MAG: hypothetical protein ACLRJV_20075 [Eubacteriales bacterium]